MKNLLLSLLFLSINAFAFSQTYTVTGNAFLENETDHSGILVTFQRTAPTSLTYTVNTDNTGAFTKDIEEGIYTVTYEKTNFITVTITDNSVYSNTQLANATLETVGLQGNLSGTLQAGTYKVSSDITVPEGQTLTIEPGTNLLFKQDIEFIVNGTLHANGTETDSIIFTRFNDGVTWKGIYVNSEQAEISYSKIMYSNDRGIEINQIDIAMPYSIKLHNSEICFNTNSGGIEISASYAILYNLSIHDNDATDNGGGVYCSCMFQSRKPIIYNCIIYNNTADEGGALYMFGGSPNILIISNCIIFSNHNSASSGALAGCESTNIRNNIIANNDGYGISYFDSNIERNYVAYNNVYGNSAGSFKNPPANVGINVTTNENGDDCDAFHNIQLDPLFTDAANFDFHLLPNSPCIDVGLNDSVCNNFDFDKNIRIWNGNAGGSAVVDMGAYEYGASPYTNIKNIENITSNLHIFPNPTTGKINFNIPSKNIKNIKITDIAGRIVVNKSVKNNNKTVDLSNFKTGIYIIYIQTDKGILTSKIVKK